MRNNHVHVIVVVLATFAVAVCGSPAAPGATGGKVAVVAAESSWGSIAAQLGGDRVQVRSIVGNPNTDPHDYEAGPADARAIAGASYVIVNGAGYDPWAQRLIDANPSDARRELDVGRLVGVRPGGNPHLWYSPAFVRQVIERITSDLKRVDPSGAGSYERLRSAYLSAGLARYDGLRTQIRQRFSGTPVGSTENIFVYLARDLGLQLVTPPAFMDAISQGSDPTPADRATFERQIVQRQIRLLVFNSQNSTPDVRTLVDRARAAGIPIAAITETPAPSGNSFQDWQTMQLQVVADGLASSS